MSVKTTVNCPDCGSPIYIESTLLLAGQRFSCSNEQCGTAISLSTEDTTKVENAYNEYENIRQQAVDQTKGQS